MLPRIRNQNGFFPKKYFRVFSDLPRAVNLLISQYAFPNKSEIARGLRIKNKPKMSAGIVTNISKSFPMFFLFFHWSNGREAARHRFGSLDSRSSLYKSHNPLNIYYNTVLRKFLSFCCQVQPVVRPRPNPIWDQNATLHSSKGIPLLRQPL